MRLLASLLVLALSLPVAAQAPLDFVRQVDPFEVRDLDGDALPYPLVGGFLAPRPHLVDLSGDGLADLVVNEGGRGLAYYESVGASGPGEGFVWRTDALDGIAPGTWSVFGDLDDDGDFDLLTQGAPSRVRYYRNDGSVTDPQFVLAADELMTSTGDAVTNEDTSVPALVDIDDDGDLDFFHGQADRGHVTFYRNDGVAPGSGLPQFTFITNLWENIEVFEDSPSCEDPKPGAPATTGFIEGRGSLHGANAVALVDLDGDDDAELFWGDFFARSLFYFLNEGTPQEPEYSLVSEAFPLDEPLTSGGYNVPVFGDVDGDGDLDLSIGILGGLCSSVENKFDNLYLYENIGTAENATFALRTERLIASLDVGERSVPTLADIDGDGDPDLVVGNDPLGLLGSTLTLFENQGTNNAPSFRLTDPNWLNLEYDFGAYAPVFADLDNDDDLDLLVGGFNGRMALLRNTGSATAPQYELEDERYQNIDVGQYIRPTFGDLDGDGDLDLLTGEANGRLKVYRNTGTAQNAAFLTEANGAPVAADTTYRAAIGLPEDLGSDSAPALADLDGDGDLDLLSGTTEGSLRFFRNTGSATAPQFVEESGVPVFRPTTTPALGDLNDDGDLDLLLGTKAGGVLYFDNAAVVGIESGIPSRPSPGIRAVPNPSTGNMTFRLTTAPLERRMLVVYDTLGQVVHRVPVVAGTERVEWDGTDGQGQTVASGLYVARLEAADRVLAAAAFTRIR
ncbi:MAG: hypothetical protein HKN04_10700 [Rhodothermaceae bacterium]|nr:hypothetical protein [Rhodothermaceae bacterium]